MKTENKRILMKDVEFRDRTQNSAVSVSFPYATGEGEMEKCLAYEDFLLHVAIERKDNDKVEVAMEFAITSSEAETLAAALEKFLSTNREFPF